MKINVGINMLTLIWFAVLGGFLALFQIMGGSEMGVRYYLINLIFFLFLWGMEIIKQNKKEVKQDD